MFYRCAVGVTPSVCSGPCRGRRRLKLQRPATRTLWTIRTQHLSDIRSDWTTITTISSLDCTDDRVITDQARRWEDEKMRLIRVEIVEKTLYNARWNSGGCRSYASCESKQLSEPVICRHGFSVVRWIDDQFQWSIIHRIGLWENLQSYIWW